MSTIQADWSELGMLGGPGQDITEILKSQFEAASGCACLVVQLPGKHSDFTILYQGHCRANVKANFINRVRPLRVQVTTADYLIRRVRSLDKPAKKLAWFEGHEGYEPHLQSWVAVPGRHDAEWVQEWCAVQNQALERPDLVLLAHDPLYWANAFSIWLSQRRMPVSERMLPNGLKRIALDLGVSEQTASLLAATRIPRCPGSDFPFVQIAEQIHGRVSALYEMWRAWIVYYSR